MSELNYISSNALPLNQNFDLLKKEGLAFIQRHSGTNWTNLNDADPGVTILDQVCYALTELGYCASFSIPDLLTKPSGEIPLEDQFYLPQEILTSTAITAKDYQKLIIDSNPAIGNAIVIPYYGNWPGISCRYSVFIRLSSNYKNTISVSDLCQQVYFLLNKNRNLGSFFDVPRVLSAIYVPVIGEIEIENSNDFGKILNEMTHAINDAIFPDVHPISITQAADYGYNEDVIYQGPRLKNGFILDEQLGTKLSSFNTMQFGQIIRKIKGIQRVVKLQFGTTKVPLYTVTANSEELIMLDLENSIKAGQLIFSSNGTNLSWQDAQQPNGAKINSVSVPKPVKSTIERNGNFRDVNTYYSIQNTFPESYGIGEMGSADGQEEHETAQAHQLRGYLTLFDQVLANQFTQLANLGTLFSFKNAQSNAPHDLANSHAQRNKLDHQPAPYPAPYQVFSPTYFCQSLYEVPDIRHLLKDYQLFNFSTEVLSQKQLDEASWKAYKNDPYNTYIQGLMNLTYRQNNNLLQRNKILNHLLARHGESPELVDAWIKGSSYTGDVLSDKIIYKSVYLQNLGLLSYYQPKGQCCYTAEALRDWNDPKIEYYRSQYGYTHDFIVNSAEINRSNKLKSSDFYNFSAIALKLNLLFGLTPLYDDYLNQSTDDQPVDINVFNQIKWFIAEQKGSIILESGLLLMSVKGQVTFGLHTSDLFHYTVDQALNYQELSILRNWLADNPIPASESTINYSSNGIEITISKQGGRFQSTNKATLLNDSIGTFELDYSALISTNEFNFLTKVDLRCIFPSYIEVLQQTQSKNRLNRFFESNLPVPLSIDVVYCQTSDLPNLISAFVNWHNAYRFSNEIMPNSTSLSSASIALIAQLNTCFN